MTVMLERWNGFERMDDRFERMDAGIAGRFERLQWKLFWAAVVIIGTLITAPHI